MIPHSTAPHAHLSSSAGDWGSPAPPHFTKLCPLSRRITPVARRGCCRLTPFGSHRGGDSGSRLRPPRTPAHAPASGPPEGAPAAPQPLAASPPLDWPAAWSSEPRLAAARVSHGSGDDARRPGSGRCPAPAAAGGASRGPTRGSQTAAVLGGASASPSRSPPAAAATTGASPRSSLPRSRPPRPSMRDRAVA